MQQSVRNNCIEQNIANISMPIQHTNQHVNASVNVDQHVNSTYEAIRQCISKRQPAC